MEKIMARCMKCKEQKEMVDPKVEKMKNNAFMSQGKCIDCGTNMAKILSKDQAEKFKK